MDGELDCDKMDYLLRDSLYCGVTYGKYDLERLISTLTVYKSEKENSLSLAVVSSGIQAFEEFVLARYFMFIQVYFHKTRRILDRLLVAALKEILPDGKCLEEITEYLKWDDVKVIETMRQSSGEEAKKFLCRDIMSCIYETPAHSSQSGKQIVNMLLEFLKMGYSSSKFFCDEVDKKAHKLLPTAYSSDDDSGKEIKLIDRHTGEAKNIMDESLILQSIVDKIKICRIYTDFANLDEQREFIRDKLLARGL
jgi:HD superfamily phosphohydrolase